VREIAKQAGFESFAVYSIEMAVDEACSNIIEHAYEGEDKGDIRCTCAVSEEAITILLQDQGKTFDPSTIPPPNLSSNLDDRKAHGLGLYFIRKWMDEVAFHTSKEGNTLKIVKRRQ
jgi:serine/threonine-protein kinase RsbW